MKSDLFFDAATGKLFWRVASGGRRMGTEAGSVAKGYRVLKFSENYSMRVVSAHHIVWFLVQGKWPEKEVDHINGDKLDNRLANLRLADRCDNMRNLPMSPRNRSGFTGVSFYPNLGKWRVKIHAEGRHIHVGVYETFEEACEARRAAELRYHGQFASCLGQQRGAA